MRNIIFFLNLQNKSKILFIILLLIIGTSLDLFGLALIIPTIKSISDVKFINDIVSNYPSLYFLKSLNQNQLIVILLTSFLIINIFKGLVFIYLSIKTNIFSREVNQKISKNLINSYSKISYEDMIEKSSSLLIRNMTEEVMGTTYALMNFLNMTVDLFVVISIFLFIFFIEPGSIFIISFIILVGLYVFRKLIIKKMIKWGQERQRFHLKKIEIINEIFHSFSELKILKKINYFGKNYIEYNKKYFDNIIKYNVLQIVPRFLLETLAVLGVVFALLYLMSLNIDQEKIIYSLALIGAAALRILPSINRVTNYYNSFKFSAASLDLIKDEILKREKELEYSTNNEKLEFFEKIEVKNIFYKYPKKKEFVLKDVSLNIFKNNIIGIKGQTGGGKSTLLKIILGLLKPNKGHLNVNGIDVHSKKQLSNWFDKIAYVPQEIYLINDTIKKNILFGSNENEINIERYKLSINLSNCDQFLGNLEDGENTIVGENGLKLSGGQKQRVGIARAIYLNRQLLILDEATNSLDEYTEKKILNNILKIKNKPTIIFVSHKSTNFDICDKIIDLKDINSQ